MTEVEETAPRADDPAAERDRLAEAARLVLEESTRLGASDAEVAVSLDTGLATTVRLGEVETVEFNRDQGIGVTVYFGQRKGSASSSDMAEASIRATVQKAVDIARYTSEDPAAGLADAELMMRDAVDLDLYHPWALDTELATEIAITCEDAARAVEGISNSDGATVYTQAGCRAYGNTHGFLGTHAGTRHGISCGVIGERDGAMERDYWYTTARTMTALEDAASVGRRAGEAAVARLGARQVSTAKVPVIFRAEIASSLVSHFLGAISGGSLYRKSSFLLDQLGEQVFAKGVNLTETPRLVGGQGSANFDSDGVGTWSKDIVADGVLSTYLLSAYSARRLDLATTGNAGGVHNIELESTAGDLDSLLAGIGSGLLVTELMGQGVNLVTGDYSRGVAGFWVENGEVQFPVEELTVAGNLKDMFLGLEAVGSDVDPRGNIRTGSIVIGEMMLGGS